MERIKSEKNCDGMENVMRKFKVWLLSEIRSGVNIVSASLPTFLRYTET